MESSILIPDTSIVSRISASSTASSSCSSAFAAQGFAIVIATNQSEIGRGLYSEADFASLMEWVKEEFARRGVTLAAVYHCPDHPTEGIGAYRRESAWRKPAPGMLLQAAKDLSLDLTRSWMVGDKTWILPREGRPGSVGWYATIPMPGRFAGISITGSCRACPMSWRCSRPSRNDAEGKRVKILVTGGAGFIGTSVVRHLLGGGASVVNLDKLTYAGSNPPLGKLGEAGNYTLEVADVADGAAVARILGRHRPDAVMHLAAETHVDRSIDRPDEFVHSNLLGTFALLEAARAYWQGLPDAARCGFRFHHISTDEVFGSLGADGRFSEEHALSPQLALMPPPRPRADHLVRAWHQTYGLPVVTTNCSNNYGPCQFPEKLIPLMILNALEGKAAADLRRRARMSATGFMSAIMRRRCALVLRPGQAGRDLQCRRRTRAQQYRDRAPALRHPRRGIAAIADRPHEQSHHLCRRPARP